jgi:hypothetical protein
MGGSVLRNDLQTDRPCLGRDVDREYNIFQLSPFSINLERALLILRSRDTLAGGSGQKWLGQPLSSVWGLARQPCWDAA